MTHLCDLCGKKGLIVEVVNKQSIAYDCANPDIS